MAVHIFDLTNLEEYRKVEFNSNHKDELFTFDALTPSTWFAFRIHYRVLFLKNVTEHGNDFVTKQELVVHTKSENSLMPQTHIEDIVATIEEAFISTQNLYVSVNSVFNDNNKIITVIVPELRCPGVGVVKPLAQQVKENHARFNFDVKTLGNGRDVEILTECQSVCLFPFLRVSLKNRTSETFRAREWCGSLSRVMQLGTVTNPSTLLYPPYLLLIFVSSTILFRF